MYVEGIFGLLAHHTFKKHQIAAFQLLKVKIYSNYLSTMDISWDCSGDCYRVTLQFILNCTLVKAMYIYT